MCLPRFAGCAVSNSYRATDWLHVDPLQMGIPYKQVPLYFGSLPNNNQMTHSDSGQSAATDTHPTPPTQLVRAIANRLRQTASYRRERLSRYARLRTRIKGPSAVSTFQSKQAPGTQACCNTCRYFADVPQMVCALHPEGPTGQSCSDCIPHAGLHI